MAIVSGASVIGKKVCKALGIPDPQNVKRVEIVVSADEVVHAVVTRYIDGTQLEEILDAVGQPMILENNASVGCPRCHRPMDQKVFNGKVQQTCYFCIGSPRELESYTAEAK